MMPVLTKADLQDWNSHPVTQQVFKEIDNALAELKSESVVRDTVDQTAMQASYNEGVAQGVAVLKETYEDLLEGAK